MAGLRDLTEEEMAGMGEAETLAHILSDVRDEDDRRVWEPSGNVRLRTDGTIDVSSLNKRQFEMYRTLLEEGLEDSQRLGIRLGEKDRRAWRSVRRRELEERQEEAPSLRRAGIALLASPFILLGWVYDVCSSGRNTGIGHRRSRSAVQGTANWAAFLVLASLLAVPAWFLATGGEEAGRLSLLLMVPTVLLMACYAPWYTLLTVFPFWILYGVASGIEHGTAYVGHAWMVGWFLAWSLYPVLRGMGHVLQWDSERRKGVPNHRITEHPWALAGLSALVAMGGHYAFKDRPTHGTSPTSP
jgi:hypothetical protein